MTSKILIVDDDPMIRKALNRNLRLNFNKNNQEFSIEQAENGEEAIKSANDFRPDIILMDMKMPVMDGIQACNILRSNPLFDPTYIILLTGDASGEVQGLSTGADDYITKPFDSEALLLRIAKGLDIAAHRSVVIQDDETGLWNREYFINCRIEGELGRAKRHGRPLSFLLMRFDLEDEPLKPALMKQLAKTLPTRHSDICVRWDGNTFAILLPETNLSGAVNVAKDLQDRFLNVDERLNVNIGLSFFDLDNQIEALPAFAETSLAVAVDVGGIVVNGTPLSSGA